MKWQSPIEEAVEAAVEAEAVAKTVAKVRVGPPKREIALVPTEIMLRPKANN